jgi:hypothetical protein
MMHIVKQLMSLTLGLLMLIGLYASISEDSPLSLENMYHNVQSTVQNNPNIRTANRMETFFNNF